MNYKSSYQKLKEKNKELLHDIKVMVMHPETEEGIDAYMKWLKKYENDGKL